MKLYAIALFLLIFSGAIFAEGAPLIQKQAFIDIARETAITEYPQLAPDELVTDEKFFMVICAFEHPCSATITFNLELSAPKNIDLQQIQVTVTENGAAFVRKPGETGGLILHDSST